MPPKSVDSKDESAFRSYPLQKHPPKIEQNVIIGMISYVHVNSSLNNKFNNGKILESARNGDKLLWTWFVCFYRTR